MKMIKKIPAYLPRVLILLESVNGSGLFYSYPSLNKTIFYHRVNFAQ